MRETLSIRCQSESRRTNEGREEGTYVGRGMDRTGVDKEKPFDDAHVAVTLGYGNIEDPLERIILRIETVSR